MSRSVDSFAPEALQPDQLHSYSLPDTGLEMGASLGNARCWVNTKGNGAIEHLFSTDLGRIVVGPMTICYCGIGSELVRDRMDPQATSACLSCEWPSAERNDAFIQLQPETPGSFDH
jgi:hypothetical protein